MGSKMAQNWQNCYIFQTKRARMLIFVPIPIFSNPRNSFIAYSASSNNSLPKMGSKMAQNWQNGYIFKSNWAILLIFVPIPTISNQGSSFVANSGTYNNLLPTILTLWWQSGLQMAQNSYIFQTKIDKIVIFVCGTSNKLLPNKMSPDTKMDTPPNHNKPQVVK